MHCPECKKRGLRSKIEQVSARSTAAFCRGFHDSAGYYHKHNSNVTTTTYECSRGHRWTAKTGHKCWCGWTNDPNQEEKPKE